jgi:hypothetical protein
MNTILASLLGGFLLAACAKPFAAVTPNGFMELEDSEARGYDYRAAHPDGIVAAVRVIRNKPEGSLTFWSRAIENQLRQVKGYRFIEQVPIKNHEGISGNLLKFGHDEGKRPHLYRVALYAKGDKLFVLELGGTAELVATHEAELTQFVEGFAIK